MTTKANIEAMSEKYKLAGSKGRKHVTFEPGDLVWLHLRKDHFPELRKSKLMPRADGPFKVLENINDNAYKLELPAAFGVSPTFNVAYLRPYLGDEDELESRTTQMQEGEDDEAITSIDTTAAEIQGPITRARARQLNYQVNSFLGIHTNILQDEMLFNPSVYVLLLRNQGPERCKLKYGREESKSFQIHLQNKAVLFRVPRLHPNSDWSVAGLSRKLLKSTFQRIQSHPQTPLECMGNRETSCISFQPSQHGLLRSWAQVQVVHAPTNPRTTRTPLKLHIWPAAALEQVGFCLD